MNNCINTAHNIFDLQKKRVDPDVDPANAVMSMINSYQCGYKLISMSKRDQMLALKEILIVCKSTLASIENPDLLRLWTQCVDALLSMHDIEAQQLDVSIEPNTRSQPQEQKIQPAVKSEF